MGEVARLLGIGTPETVRKWVRQAEVDGGRRPGTTTEESAELKRLRRENAELKRANAILKAASTFLLRGRARPATSLIVEFIRSHHRHREAGGLVWGVEPICTVLSEHGLPIAPSTYYDHLDRTPSRREIRDQRLEAEIARVHAAHYGVYGARKVWLQPNREAVEVARCAVERLMRRLGLAGAVRGKVKRTTVADRATRLPRSGAATVRAAGAGPVVGGRPDHVTWSGWVYVAFVVDAYARRILGWRTGTTMATQLVLDAVEQAIWTRPVRAGRI